MVRHRIGDGGRLSLTSSIIEELVATLSKEDYYSRRHFAIAVLQATGGILKSTLQYRATAILAGQKVYNSS
jgi:hypothetical protein